MYTLMQNLSLPLDNTNQCKFALMPWTSYMIIFAHHKFHYVQQGGQLVFWAKADDFKSILIKSNVANAWFV